MGKSFEFSLLWVEDLTWVLGSDFTVCYEDPLSLRALIREYHLLGSKILSRWWSPKISEWSLCLGEEFWVKVKRKKRGAPPAFNIQTAVSGVRGGALSAHLSEVLTQSTDSSSARLMWATIVPDAPQSWQFDLIGTHDLFIWWAMKLNSANAKVPGSRFCIW